MGSSVPKNTTADARDNPGMALVEMMVLGAEGSILAQEARGQREVVDCDTLPTDCGGPVNVAVLESWGFVFMGPVEGDPLFQRARLPAGWRKATSPDSSYHTDILDEFGRKRASVFYKAAFYDRRAGLALTRRIGVEVDYDRHDADGCGVVFVMDAGEAAYTTQVYEADEAEPYAPLRKAEADALAWLSEHRPNWREPGAYWDDNG